jgi:hypothetical protein
LVNSPHGYWPRDSNRKRTIDGKIRLQQNSNVMGSHEKPNEQGITVGLSAPAFLGCACLKNPYQEKGI